MSQSQQKRAPPAVTSASGDAGAGEMGRGSSSGAARRNAPHSREGMLRRSSGQSPTPAPTASTRAAMTAAAPAATDGLPSSRPTRERSRGGDNARRAARDSEAANRRPRSAVGAGAARCPPDTRAPGPEHASPGSSSRSLIGSLGSSTELVSDDASAAEESRAALQRVRQLALPLPPLPAPSPPAARDPVDRVTAELTPDAPDLGLRCAGQTPGAFASSSPPPAPALPARVDAAIAPHPFAGARSSNRLPAFDALPHSKPSGSSAVGVAVARLGLAPVALGRSSEDAESTRHSLSASHSSQTAARTAALPRPPSSTLSASLNGGAATHIPFSTCSPNRSALPSEDSSFVSAAPSGSLTGVAAATAAEREDGPSGPAPSAARVSPHSSRLHASGEAAAHTLDMPTSTPTADEEGASDAASAAEAASREGCEAEAVESAPVLATHMPHGRCVVLNLLSTWGDEYEVGLRGVELFDERGRRVLPHYPPSSSSSQQQQQQQQQSAADAITQTLSVDANGVATRGCVVAGTTLVDGVRVVAEYSASDEELAARRDRSLLEAQRTDPRRQLANLLSGQQCTHDERSMYAMPFTAGQHHLICFVLPRATTLSVVRLCNYCGQGRVHTSKGARLVEIVVDDECVFRGEVRQHSGEWLQDASQAGLVDCENILYTEDRQVLEAVMTAHGSGRTSGSGGQAGSAAAPSDSGAQGEGARGGRTTGHRREGVTLVIRSHVDACAGTHAPPMESAPLPPRPASVSADSTRDERRTVRLRPPPCRTAAGTPQKSRPLTGGGVAARTTTTTATTAAAGGNSGVWKAPAVSPATRMTRTVPQDERDEGLIGSLGEPAPSLADTERSTTAARYPSHCPAGVSSACVMLLATWGDVHEVGLSGLRLRDARGDVISLSQVRCTVQYPDGSHAATAEQARLQAGVTGMLTASVQHRERGLDCLLPFVPAMQIILEFATSLPTVGFFEVANYSSGERTFSGAKEARVFLSDAPAPGSSSSPGAAAAAAYGRLWTATSSTSSRRALWRARVMEVTPSAGVCLRKAPARIVGARYQTYDLSLQSTGPPLASAGRESGASSLVPSPGSPAAAGQRTFPSAALDARYRIAEGPGTGGEGGYSGGLRSGGFVGPASAANSLNASMNVRAAVAMRRARMTLYERPPWLLACQPYVTPLLPVGYVLKVRLLISARSVSGRCGGPADSSADDRGSFYIAGTTILKAFLRDWVTDPFASLSMRNESNQRIHPLPPGQTPEPPSNREESALEQTRGGELCVAHSGNSLLAPAGEEGAEDDALESCTRVPMVAESVLTTLPSTTVGAAAAVPGSLADGPPLAERGLLNVALELMYVADCPFCLSALRFHRPLVLDGSAAWVRQLQVRMDDALLFDSGDALLSVRGSRKSGGDTPSPSRGPHEKSATPSSVSTQRPAQPATVEGRVAGTPCAPPRRSSAGADSATGGTAEGLLAGLDLVPCATSLWPCVLFTLDREALRELKDEMARCA